MSVKNYAPELIELFRVATQQEVVIELTTKSAAHRLRFRMHNLRADMRKEHHPLLALAELSQLSVTGEGNSWQLTIFPADSDFVGAIRAAGVTIDLDLEPAKDEEGNLPTADDAGAVASAVSNFMNKKGEG